jgi:hypothetical protein
MFPSFTKTAHWIIIVLSYGLVHVADDAEVGPVLKKIRSQTRKHPEK